MPHWSEQRERSNLFWLSALSWSANTLGRGFLRVLCVPIAFFFLLTAAGPRRVSREFLGRVLPRRPGLWHTFRHFYTFALVSADRLLFLAGKSDRFELSFHGDDIVRQYAAQGRGCLLLVSHLGSFDAMRVPAVNDERIPVRILIDKSHNPAAMRVIETLNPEMARAAIDAGVDATQLVLSVSEAVSVGHMVGIMADRAARGEAQQRMAFLGEEASFPAGPWVMALVLRAPVILCFAVYEGGNRYSIRFREVHDGQTVSRRDRQVTLQDKLAQYVAELEKMARAHPYNWFNFYDFWLDDASQNH